MSIENFISELRKLDKDTDVSALKGFYSYRCGYGDASLCTIDDGYELHKVTDELDDGGYSQYELKESGDSLPSTASGLADFLEESYGLNLELYKGGFMELCDFTTLHICSTWGDYSEEDLGLTIKEVSEKGIELRNGNFISFSKKK